MLTLACVALAITLVATPGVRAAARRLGLVDLPDQRSSHVRPRPRAGGVAVVLGVGAALVAADVPWARHPALVALLTGGLLLAVVGLLDDRFDLPPLPRLAVQILAAALVVWAAGGFARLPLPAPLNLALAPTLGMALAVFWVVAVTNLYNFMDGIDGLAALQGCVTAAAIALALGPGSPAAALLAAALAGSALAFLVYNWEPASIFLGDVGSGVVGYTLASLALLAPAGEHGEVALLVAASLFLFLADTTTCLMGRLKRGEHLFEAHRQHLYQRWVATGVRHRTVSLWLGAGTLVTTAVALAGWWTGEDHWYWISLGLGGAFLVLEAAVVQRREGRASGGRSPR